MSEVRIGIVGCGLIGTSWSALFRSHGYEIVGWDPSETARSTFADRVADVQITLRELGIADNRQLPGIEVAGSLEELAVSCEFIQENAPESVTVKRELFERIAKVMSSSGIVASSTSSLTWPEIFGDLPVSSRWLTAHPFNPPHLVPLVELYSPDQGTIAKGADLYRSLGKCPVILKKPAVGHIANRLASALWREAVDMVANGTADPEDIDRALVQGPGLRWSIMGAHMAYHLGGGSGGIRDYLQHLGPSQERRWSTLGQSMLTPDLCERIAAGVERAAGGRDVATLEIILDRSLMAVLNARKTIPD